jgi:metal-responsive CopG/Arc/MetJ family transcriptional regulator
MEKTRGRPKSLEKSTRLTINIPNDLANKIKQVSANSVSAEICKAIKFYLERHQNGSEVTEQD